MESKPILTKFLIDDDPYKMKPVNHNQTLKEIRAILALQDSILFKYDGTSINKEDEEYIKLTDICQDSKTVYLTQDSSKINSKPLENATFLKKVNELDLYLYPDWSKIEKDKVLADAQLKGKKQNEIEKLLTKFSPFSDFEEAQAKVIMVVGQTGSGKTTLLNFFINFLTGVQFSDNFRYILINEQTGKAQALSQTSHVNVYYVKSHREGCPPIKLVDTPGFGDTRGIKQDQIISGQIKDFFVNHLDSIDAICFVAQSSNARLTAHQTYIFSKILEMYGKDVAENFVCMITFCDNDEPKVLEALSYPGDPYYQDERGELMPQQKSIFCDLIPLIKEPWYLKFNNSALFQNNKCANLMIKLFWDLGIQSFDDFMKKKIQFLKRKSLVQTREVLDERERLEATIISLQPYITLCLSTMDKKKELQEKIKLNADLIEAHKDFSLESEVPQIIQIDLSPSEYVTNCLQCNQTCHYPCQIPDNEKKEYCAIMTEGKCTYCIGRCHWNLHKNMQFRFEIKTQKIKTDIKEMKEKYCKANSQKSNFEQIMAGLHQELIEQANNCIKNQDTIRKCTNRLNQIALRSGCYESTDQYIDIMIISEESDKKQGYEGRIKVLKELKSQGKYAQEALKGDGVFKELKGYI